MIAEAMVRPAPGKAGSLQLLTQLSYPAAKPTSRRFAASRSTRDASGAPFLAASPPPLPGKIMREFSAVEPSRRVRRRGDRGKDSADPGIRVQSLLNKCRATSQRGSRQVAEDSFENVTYKLLDAAQPDEADKRLAPGRIGKSPARHGTKRALIVGAVM